ncbi:uncharacterized protein LOC123988233 [Osmia bicornis bicornis]|uniref:uncharacterized protein LOC123988233 n=1 Tax=Osmia bicornis bicornis TaxID=1437191 RepID=UPI001EAF0442|nr:uncharacterized protein LOC123988233 [Osmia bicornis bicornis]
MLLQLQQQILDIQKNIEMLKGKHDGYITAQAQRSPLLDLYEPDEPHEHIVSRFITFLFFRYFCSDFVATMPLQEFIAFLKERLGRAWLRSSIKQIQYHMTGMAVIVIDDADAAEKEKAAAGGGRRAANYC